MGTLSSALFAGIDVGSGSVRAGLYDTSGRRLAFSTRPILQFRPRDLFVEQSSADIWANACLAMREALAEAEVDPARVTAIGVDATCSLVVVGASGAPVSVAEDGDPAGVRRPNGKGDTANAADRPGMRAERLPQAQVAALHQQMHFGIGKNGREAVRILDLNFAVVGAEPQPIGEPCDPTLHGARPEPFVANAVQPGNGLTGGGVDHFSTPCPG